MIIECSACHAKYQYDEDRFERKPSKKIKCAKCQTVFEIHNPAFAAAAPAPRTDTESTASKQQAKPEPKHESTQIGRPKRFDEETAQSEIPENDARSTGKQTAALVLPVGKRLSLAIIDGPDAGSVFRIEKPRITIGRAAADFTLNDSEASRQHAVVEIHDTLFQLQDLGSTNGTLVSGTKITETVELQNHSEFQVGATTLMLIVTDES